jgi:hypothetical protein
MDPEPQVLYQLTDVLVEASDSSTGAAYQEIVDVL